MNNKQAKLKVKLNDIICYLNYPILLSMLKFK